MVTILPNIAFDWGSACLKIHSVRVDEQAPPKLGLGSREFHACASDNFVPRTNLLRVDARRR